MRELPDFDLHIFDLDDTLINTREAYFSAQEKAVREVFPSLIGNSLLSSLQELRWLCQIFGSGHTESYFSAFVASRPDLQVMGRPLATLLTTGYQAAFLSNLKPLAGAMGYLHNLTNRSKKLALVSNGITASQVKKLHLTEFDTFFPPKHCFISEAYLPAQKKPSPHMVELACKSAGIDAGRSIFYGNSAEDILAGNLAGVATVLIGEDSGTEDKRPEIALPDFRFESWID
ncbi:MAG: HAD hydrolase-like protein [Deltaproteobacteria bacterium]|jgi:FMN phosphatase YigB (HAD superfamily)|nr:HAD hydrolase-like protein [Deltaproteobacteria bacterium]MBT4267255.1 HAD hydrolase-like protein [Deltaproteobacteria bacterium]MBT4639347.1 HAD hydrolase-like protein [Deltaproteobacteria bacterium]MBT6504649.1 HAD hydrolase-like protein [Deltaproteobacteria bacterium]MBT6613185.1 HAD hydrolase-like protein [Deltaproteobacteria bacterium]